MTINRRDFLRDSARWTAALASAGTGAGTALAAEPMAPRGPNETLRVAVVGLRNRGFDLVQAFAGNHNCVVTTVCDVDTTMPGKSIEEARKAQGKPPKFEQDVRKVVDDKSIDLVCICTPNHWHALLAVWAMRAGKDVYVEKPVSHNISEGRRMVQAARKYNRICQAGTQSRSMAGLRSAMDFLHAGKLGKITLARGLCIKPRKPIGKVAGPQPVPGTVNYDLWCGPTAVKPLMRTRLHYDWHWVWDTGNGDIANQGAHEMEVARWGLGKQELPKSVLSLGGRLGPADDGQTPNVLTSFYDYGDCRIIFEVRDLKKARPYRGAKIGVVFEGTQGSMVCIHETSEHTLSIAYDPAGKEIQKFSGKGDHFANFVKAVRSRKPADLNCDILEGHLSSSLSHLGNISYRLGKPTALADVQKAVAGDKEAAATLERQQAYLKENKIALDKPLLSLGRKLTIAAGKEQFVNDKEADALLTREYRKGFEFGA